MKKCYALFLLTVLFNINVKAAIVVISATNFQFSPANTNVLVGDIVRFTFSGFHNATTNNVPDGLPTGAAPLYSGGLGSVVSYEYTVTEAGTYKYICELHGDAFAFAGMVGQFTASDPTPVILNKFTVSTTEKKPLLSWSTATELNADYFSIRRSTDAINFIEIDKVRSLGNSSIQQNYSYTDNTISNDQYIYYELAIVDKDGKEKLSEIKMFKNPSVSYKLIKQLSPNPITRPGQLMVYFNAEKPDKMKVQVFDIAGKLVYDTYMSAVTGLNSGHVHICDFTPGTYTLEFTMNNIRELKKVVVN
ncbi:MAG: T9SS type A sorting domain-containing protein [Bacteroidota bacterium]